MTQRIPGEERRAQLIDAALALFAEHGYDGTSTRVIAAAVGVTEGLIFKYFPTKRDLLRAVIERHAPCPTDMEDWERQMEGEPVHKALEILLDHMADWLWNHRQFIQMVLVESYRQGEAFQELVTVMERGPQFLYRLLEARAANGEIRLADPAAAAEMLGGAVFALFQRHKHRGEEDWRRRSHRFIRGAIRLFLDGARGPGER